MGVLKFERVAGQRSYMFDFKMLQRETNWVTTRGEGGR